MRRLVVGLWIGLLSGCDLLPTGDDPTLEGFCGGYRIDDWWPVDATQVVHEPGDLVSINPTAGGVDTKGIGGIVPTEVVWDGVVYGIQGDESTLIGMPMEPGTYTVRTQQVGCPEVGNDYELTVEHPTPFATVTPPALTGPDIIGQRVAWEADGSRYRSVVYDGTTTHLVEVDPGASTVEAWDCEPCWHHLAYSQDGQWFAQGDRLYRWQDDAWFYVTSFEEQFVHFPPHDPSMVVLYDEDTESVWRVDLATGERVFAFAATSFEALASDGFAVANRGLVDVDTGKLASDPLTDLTIRYWDPARNRAYSTSSPKTPAYLDMYQGLPTVDLPGKHTCLVGYRHAQFEVDPLGAYVISYGVIGSEVSIFNPWFEICAIDDDHNGFGAKYFQEFPPEYDVIYRKAEHIDWSPDGQTLAVAGLTGVYTFDRKEIEALVP